MQTFLVPMLTTNECTIQDSFTFAKELQSFDSRLVMASFDIDSLSTFLCKKQLTSILKNYLYKGLMLIICRTTLSMSCLLGPCLNHWSYLIMNSINSIAELEWVPPWDLHFPIAFLCFDKKDWLQNCPS